LWVLWGSRYVEADWKFKELDGRLLDQCSLALPNKNWTAIHDKALEDLQLAARLSGSAVGRCAELARVQEELTQRPVMEAPQRMWKKDPELYSPEDKPRFSFLLQVSKPHPFLPPPAQHGHSTPRHGVLAAPQRPLPEHLLQ